VNILFVSQDCAASAEAVSEIKLGQKKTKSTNAGEKQSLGINYLENPKYLLEYIIQ